MASTGVFSRGRLGLCAGSVVLLLALAGCAGESPGVDPGDDPTSTGPDASVVSLGSTWVRAATPTALEQGEFVSGFSAGGEFWFFDQANQTLLQRTSDGATWADLDVTAHGVPATSQLATSGNRCGVGPVVNETNGVVNLVYSKDYNNKHPLGIDYDFYVVTLDGDAVSVERLADKGFERMPAKQGTLNYRTSCAAGLFTVDDTRVVVGNGQWWEPYNTGGFHPFVSIEGADGQWTVQPLVQASEIKGVGLPISAALEHDGVIVIAGPSTAGAQVWSSTGGQEWQRHVLSAGGEAVQQVWAVSSDAGVVVMGLVHGGSVAGVDEYSYYAWPSADGHTWGDATLLAEHAESAGAALFSLPHGVYASIPLLEAPAEDAADVSVLRSVDGAAWADFEIPKQSAFHFTNQLFAHGEGLVSVNRLLKAVLSTGLDWAAQ